MTILKQYGVSVTDLKNKFKTFLRLDLSVFLYIHDIMVTSDELQEVKLYA